MGILNSIVWGVLQGTEGDFMHSMITVIIFLTVLALVGFLIVQICRRADLIKIAPKVQVNEADKITVLDTKFLYGRRCLYLIKCSGRKILFLVDREHLCKLGDWVEGSDVEDNR